MVGTDPKLRDFFSNAVQCQTSEEQAAYLEQVCQGNAELRARLDELLQAHREAGSFLKEPSVAPAQTVDEPRVSEHPGTVIGPYKLLQQIGEGGMGVVWMAEQTQPVQRKVALKVIKPGMDSSQVIARFEAERQALAMMDHVNIARVFDAGATEAGRPYFVMELVHGIPITKYCDDNHLAPRERLELFVPVCQAIQHAHQKGIIHRDIKPSNVMITLYDGKPVPKVIDFGVAKATEQKLTERTLFTQYGTMVGTLEYMSPEQAEMSALGVDTRSDIYSLGVLLYELLTGNTPLTHKRMREGAYAEILRMIKEEEPPKPSTRLSDSGEALASISVNRHMEPAKLTKLMRGELDWIVMKTLEKDRNRRYETANGFAMDIQRYLADEPVQACPPSTWYRFRKFAHRQKTALTIAVVVAMLLLLSTAISTWQAIRATEAEGLAEDRLGKETIALNAAVTAKTESEQRRLDVTRERDEKVKALALALQEKQRADQNLAHARKAVKDYLTKAAGNRLLKEANFHALRRELLESALPFYQEFVKQKSDDPELEADRGDAYSELARVRHALGEFDQALADHEQRKAIFERLAANHPKKSIYRVEVVDCYRDIGNVYSWKNQPAKAEEAFRHALKLTQALRDEAPAFLPYRRNQASLWGGLGVVLDSLGRLDEALALHQKAIDLELELVMEAPKDLDCRQNLGLRLINFGSLLRKVPGRLDDALTMLEKSEDLFQKLAEEFPTTPGYREYWAVALNNKSAILSTLGRHKEGHVAQERAVEIQEKLARDFRSVPGYRLNLAEWHMNLSVSLTRLGRHEQSLAACDKAVSILERLLEESPEFPEYRQVLGLAYHNRGESLRQRNSKEALDALKKAVHIRAKLEADFPRTVHHRQDLGMTYFEMGELLMIVGRTDDADNAYAKGLQLFETLAHDFPKDTSYAVSLAGFYRGMGSLVLRRGQREAALDWYAKALAKLEPVLANEPRAQNARRYASITYAGRALAHGELGRHAEALKDWDQALAHGDAERREELKLHRAATFAILNPIPPIPLKIGDIAKGTLASSDAPDSFPLTRRSHHKVHAVQLDGGQPYLIDLKGDFDTFLRLEDAQKKHLMDNDDVGTGDLNSRLVFIPPQAGTYCLVVTSFKPGDTGAYTLSVQKAVNVGKPILIEGKLQDTDQKTQGKFFKLRRLNLAGGSPYTIELESPTFDTFVALMGADGRKALVQNDGIAPGNKHLSRVDFTPEADGAFHILVTSSGPGETGAFRLQVKRYEAVKEKKK